MLCHDLVVAWIVDGTGFPKKRTRVGKGGPAVLRPSRQTAELPDLWRAYIQLTEAEAAFHIHKSDPVIRPVWHLKEHCVQGANPSANVL